jgi:hypothetical protein
MRTKQSGGFFLFFVIFLVVVAGIILINDPSILEGYEQPSEATPRPSGAPYPSGPPDVGGSENRYSIPGIEEGDLAMIHSRMCAAYRDYLSAQQSGDYRATSNQYQVYVNYKRALDEKLRRCRDNPREQGCYGPSDYRCNN